MSVSPEVPCRLSCDSAGHDVPPCRRAVGRHTKYFKVGRSHCSPFQGQQRKTLSVRVEMMTNNARQMKSNIKSRGACGGCRNVLELR